MTFNLRTAGVLVAFVACVASCVLVRASPSCMTFGEARAAFPGKHLWWHTAAKCWDANGYGRAAARRAPRPAAPADKTPMIMFPALVQHDAPPDAQLLAGSPMTDGPLILDIDVETADRDPPDCCWPAFDGPPPATFRERWAAMPAIWILAATQ